MKSVSIALIMPAPRQLHTRFPEIASVIQIISFNMNPTPCEKIWYHSKCQGHRGKMAHYVPQIKDV